MVCVNRDGLRGFCLWLVGDSNSLRHLFIYFYSLGAHSDTMNGLYKSSARHGNASQSSRRSCSFHAWVCDCVRAGWACVLMMCERACKYQRGKRRRWSLAPSRSILSTLLQKSFISLDLTATNLWLHYYRRCFILVPTRKPGTGLVNGEGDGEGDQPELLLHHWVGWALKWKNVLLFYFGAPEMVPCNPTLTCYCTQPTYFFLTKWKMQLSCRGRWNFLKSFCPFHVCLVRACPLCSEWIVWGRDQLYIKAVWWATVWCRVEQLACII